MTGLRFDEEDLLRQCDQLPESLRVAFAAACAERLLPACEKYSVRTGQGQSVRLAKILARLWDDLEGNLMSDEEVHEQILASTELIPREEEAAWGPDQAAAEDAAAAVTYALQCRQCGAAQHSIWAARRVHEALDTLVTSQVNIDLNRPGAEEMVLAHPSIQTELARQRRDLTELSQGTASPASLRARATAEARSCFPG